MVLVLYYKYNEVYHNIRKDQRMQTFKKDVNSLKACVSQEIAKEKVASRRASFNMFNRTCSTCPAYRRSLQRCVYGRVLPKSIKHACELVRSMGATYLCKDLNSVTLKAIIKRLEETPI